MNPTHDRPPAAYRRAMGLAVAALVSIVILYAVLVIGLAALTVWHAWSNHAWLGSGISASLVYLFPILGGTLVCLFLVKPFFARRPDPIPARPIQHQDHPRLFQLIGAICQEVGTCPPSRVEIDCSINASVRFREGWSSMATHDLCLTIGLPLASAFTARELGGVIAHEFGHFRQDSGLRLTFIIRSLSFWLWRVVHERDVLDEQLDQAIENFPAHVSVLLRLTRFGINLSRHFLRLLMLAGHASCCRLLRQMEFDADRHEVRVAGSDAFLNTARQLRLLGAAAGQSGPLLARAWRERRLPDNLPAYIRHLALAIPPENQAQIHADALARTTGTFDTHPADAEREQAARNAALPGILDIEEPAADLFNDFHDLCRSITREHYARLLGAEPEASRLEATATATAAIDDEVSTQRVVVAYAPALGDPSLRIPWPPIELDPLPDLSSLHATIAASRSILDSVGDSLSSPIESRNRARSSERRVAVARALSAAAIRWKPDALGLPSADPEVLDSIAESSSAERLAAEDLIRPVATESLQRVQAALCLWWADPRVLQDCPSPEAVREEILALEPLVRCLFRNGEELDQLEILHDALHVVLGSGDQCRDLDAGHTAVHDLAAQIRRVLRKLLPEFAGIRQPFLDPSSPPMSVREFLLREADSDDGLQGAYAETAALRRFLPDICDRALTRLVALAYEAERRAAVGG